MRILDRLADLFERQVVAFEAQSRAIIRQAEAHTRHLDSVAAVNEANAKARSELQDAFDGLRFELAELRNRQKALEDKCEDT